MCQSKKSLINKLYCEATNSEIKQQLAAAILKSGKMISNPCCNSLRNTCRGANVGSLHAEAHAIINHFGKSLSFNKKNIIFHQSEKKNNQNLDLIVIRVNKLGEICNSRPCYNCLNLMKIVGIRKIYYSISESELVCENVKDMISIHSSAVTKNIDKQYNNYLFDTCNEYYETLLKENFPSVVRQTNLDNFIRYNLSVILPDYKVKIKNNYNNNYVWIFDSNDNIIIKSTLLP